VATLLKVATYKIIVNEMKSESPTDTPVPYFDIPLDIPHAGKIATRICVLLDSRGYLSEPRYLLLLEKAQEIENLLSPYRYDDDNPPDEESERIQREAATLGRELIVEIERVGAREDRLGQCIRNLFECLEMGREGATLSLRAGENPQSLQRPA